MYFTKTRVRSCVAYKNTINVDRTSINYMPRATTKWIFCDAHYLVFVLYATSTNYTIISKNVSAQIGELPRPFHFDPFNPDSRCWYWSFLQRCINLISYYYVF